jgi:hypothetical protein
MKLPTDTQVKVRFDAKTASATIWPNDLQLDKSPWPSMLPQEHFLLSWGHMTAGWLAARLESYDQRVVVSVSCAELFTAVTIKFGNLGADVPEADVLFAWIVSRLTELYGGVIEIA